MATPSSRAEGPSSTVSTVAAVLRCFTVDEPQLGVTEIANRVGLHKSSASRLLVQLEKERLVEREGATRKYRLGAGLMGIAGPLLSTMDIRRLAAPFLERLRDESGETAALAIFDGVEAITVEQVPSLRPVKHTALTGTRYVSALSASMQVFLSLWDTECLAAALKAGGVDLSGAAALTAYEYSAILDGVRERGFSVNYGLTSPDEVGVAAPVRDHSGEVAGALLVAAPLFRVSEDDATRMGVLVREVAGELSKRLGHSG